MRKQMDRKTVVVVDGMGAGLGKGIVERLCNLNLNIKMIVVGTNSAATANMMRPGVAAAATGENACIYNCGKADIVLGPIGIILPNAMNGEISPKMALAIAESEAEKILIPVSNQHFTIAGIPNIPLSHALDDVAARVSALLGD